MAIAPKLELRASQSLVMTPQLQQAIKLLQMNALDIETWLEEQIESNPFLEKEEEVADAGENALSANEPTEALNDSPPDSLSDSQPDSLANPLPETREADEGNTSEGEERDAFDALESTQADQESLDVSYENVFDGDAPFSDVSRAAAPSTHDLLPSDLEDETTRSLSHHLHRQLGLDMTDAEEQAIGAFFIDSLDENGFLRLKASEAASQLGCPVEQVEEVLTKLRQFDPPGLFAYDLKDCLRLQLQDSDALTEPLEALLANLDLLANGVKETLRKRCALGSQEFEEALATIRSLNPRPAAAFDHRPVQTVVPDLLMREVKQEEEEEGGGDIWRVELNNETLPRVLLSRDYHAEVASDVSLRGDAQAQEFLKEHWQSANWIVKALDQRAQTILKVAAEIVKRQRGFFRYGIARLAPLVLRDIADAISMHESTVSRVVNGKYMQTPRGMFELRYFFTKAIPNSIMRTSLSAKAVRHRIRQLIDEEEPKATLSDDKIVDKLKEEGVEIARRTVTKYREAMRIGSSVERRRRHALQ